MTPRWRLRLTGFLIAVLGAGFTAWMWYTAMTEGSFYQGAGIAFPAFFVMGVAAMVLRGEDIARGETKKRLTPLGWVLVVVALICGLVNVALLYWATGISFFPAPLR